MDKVVCIPTHTSISAVLFEQWIECIAKWCAKNNIEILTIPNRTHNDAELVGYRWWWFSISTSFNRPNGLYIMD